MKILSVELFADSADSRKQSLMNLINGTSQLSNTGFFKAMYWKVGYVTRSENDGQKIFSAKIQLYKRRYYCFPYDHPRSRQCACYHA